MLKRLDRLDEAAADLHVAEQLATAQYDQEDVRYNLACVHAMTGKLGEAKTLVEPLRGTQYIDAIRANLHGYFELLADDTEFLDLLAV
jgi:Flp pilus assembly protein TadD